MDKPSSGLKCVADSGPVYVDGQPITGEVSVNADNCVSTGDQGQARITDGGVTAATVAGPNSQVTPHRPPTTGLSLTYYRSSARWELKTPGGSVGIRA
jgi:hypothetical protein